jgi:hypothetical protein
MKLILAFWISVILMTQVSLSSENKETQAFEEANLYRLSGSLISSNIYLTYLSIDMLFTNANNYSNEEKQVIRESIKLGFEKTKKDFFEVNSYIEFPEKKAFEEQISEICSLIAKDLELLKEYLESNEDSIRQLFLENHKRLWNQLSKNTESNEYEKD